MADRKERLETTLPTTLNSFQIVHSTPANEFLTLLQVNLIEWLKDMVGSRRSEEIVDPKLSEKPSLKSLKRALLIALRCVDPDSSKRPKMGHVIHMLEADDVLFREVYSV